MKPDMFLFFAGTVGGLAYWFMGIAATSKLESKEKLTPGMQWFPGIWSLSPREYSGEGKRLCRFGNIVMVLTILCWVGWAMIKR